MSAKAGEAFRREDFFFTGFEAAALALFLKGVLRGFWGFIEIFLCYCNIKIELS